MFRSKRHQDNGEKTNGKIEPLILQNSRIKFSPEQLQNLNFLLCKKLDKKLNKIDSLFQRAVSVAERLTQRLLCVAGRTDPRFASKFLVDNKPGAIQSEGNHSLSFLVRIDDLSTPPLYELDTITKLEIIENDSDCPPGYCRIRLPPSKMRTWNEFINPNGFLRRDKVQTRLVKLLAEAAEEVQPIPPQNVDESVLCGIPGKIVDAATLYHLLMLPSFEQLYYGQDATAVGFPDPSNFRIAILDEPQGILLRLEFLSPIFNNITLDVRLILAIGIDAWPSTSDFPGRILLTHPDCLLYNKASQTGAYLVGFGVQSSAWQMRVPAVEYTILNHYGETSSIKSILNILRMAEEEIDKPRWMKQNQISYKILNKYIFLTCLFEALENYSTKPMTDAINWCSLYTSKIVLTILDQLLLNLTQQKLPNYFFKKSNLLVNPGHLSEDDYIIEANNVKKYILKLYDESLQNLSSDAEFKMKKRDQENEINFLLKWKSLIDGMMPRTQYKTEGFRLRKSKRCRTVHPTYTRFQLEYISSVLASTLRMRKKIIKGDVHVEPLMNSKEDNDSFQDALYLTVFLMDQAKESFNKKYVKSKNKNLKLKSQYRWYLSKFIARIMEDTCLQMPDLDDNVVMVETIITFLYKAAEFNEKCLGRFLQPYLKDLFEVSFAISWHLEDMNNRSIDDELNSLGCFCKLLNSGEISPIEGLLDAEKKKWEWAKDMLKVAERMDIRMVLIPDREQVNQYVLYSTDRYKEDQNVSPNNKNFVSRTGTFLCREYIHSLKKPKGVVNINEENLSKHAFLKMRSPLTSIISNIHRRGQYRGCGDTIKSLTYMKKMGVFQEVTSTLSDEEKNDLIEILNDLEKKQDRDIPEKSWTNTLPKMRNIQRKSNDVIQKYKPMEESAGITDTGGIRKYPEGDTLIKYCRTLRLKEDNTNLVCNTSFRLKEIIKKMDAVDFK